MASHDGVEITPSDLKFRFQLNKQLLGNININNTTDKRVAFKIKTTAPKKYVVRPSSGVTDLKSSASVQVIMQAQKDYPLDFQASHGDTTSHPGWTRIGSGHGHGPTDCYECSILSSWFTG